MELHEPKNLYELLTLNMEQRFANRVAFRWYDADQDVVVEKHFGEYAQDIRRAVNYYLSTIPDIQGKRVEQQQLPLRRELLRCHDGGRRHRAHEPAQELG